MKGLSSAYAVCRGFLKVCRLCSSRKTGDLADLNLGPRSILVQDQRVHRDQGRDYQVEEKQAREEGGDRDAETGGARALQRGEKRSLAPEKGRQEGSASRPAPGETGVYRSRRMSHGDPKGKVARGQRLSPDQLGSTWPVAP